MTESLENAVEQVVAVLSGVAGLRDVPVNPPEQMGAQTFAVAYPQSGKVELSPTGTRRSLHNIAVDVLTVRTDLARDIALVKPFIDTVPDALLRQVSYDSDGNPGGQFAGSIETFASLSYSWMTSNYAGVDVVGYHFLMEDVKILVNL